MKLAAIAPLLLAGALLPTARACAQAPSLTLQDLLSVDPVSDTALSPDGKTFAIVRDGQIALLPAGGGWPQTLTTTQGGKTGLAWSPDGTRIAYSSRGGIWVVAAAGGEPQRLSDAPPGPGDPRQATDRDPRWSPNGHWILFTSGRRGPSSLYLVSGDGSATLSLTPKGEEGSGGRWSPDGTHIAFIEREKSFFSGRLRVLTIDPHSGAPTGPAQTLYTAPVDRGGGWSIRESKWSPDGKSLLVVLQTDGWDHLYLIPAAGGTPRQLTTGDSEDGEGEFSPDGREIAFTSNRGLSEATGLWTVSSAGGQAREAARFSAPGVTSDPEWSPDGRTLYFHHQSATESTDLYSVASGSAHALTQTTPLNFLAAAHPPERVTWKSKDGTEIAGLLYHPPAAAGAGHKLPAVLWIHGGPEGQDTLHLDIWAQYLAAHGYLVLEPNYRGSTGYGEHFRNLNVEDSGGGEVDDVAAGVRYLVASENADPARIGIGGGSHGGTMVAYAVTRYPQLFAAAEELFGVVDRELFLYRTNPDSATRWAMKMGGSPTEKPDNYRRANVLLAIDQVRTPLLVMHGEDDPQVPPAESARFVEALRAHHKTVLYFTYPGELHGFSQPQHRLDAWGKERAFFDHYLKPSLGTTETSTEEVVLPGTGKDSVATSHNPS